MNTTNLFVELLVIGSGTLGWFVLLVLSVFGWDWVPADGRLSMEGLLLLLPLVYVLGIVSDRIADVVFEKLWSDGLRRAEFATNVEYHEARRVILTRAERLTDLLEYSRSRLRISRGWAFNAVLLAVCLNLFVWLRLPGAPLVAVFGTASLMVLAWACWFTWRHLTVAEYRKVREQAAFLLAQGPAPKA